LAEVAGNLIRYPLCRLAARPGFLSRLIFGSCLVASLFALSCATPYKPLSDRYGYSERPVGKDEFEVTFLANGNTPYERAFDFALLRAAEIALSRQAKSFRVSDLANLGSLRSYESPPHYFEATSAYLASGGQTVPSAPEFISGTERTYLMMTMPEERVYYRPGVKLKIKLLPDAPGSYYPYDPARLIEQLKLKYGI
jgi:hypothetical protein